MPSFRYKHGDRPLDGYTIQRGVGRGGFGEVYYAVSDSGREVALKVIQGYEQIELRGVSQCMNLKSPNLVSIFDVRHNAEGVPFVIMEYVAGPSLRELIDQQPAGLGIQKAAFFLREIGKGLTFLHDCGIVHRDLKPGNIFYENGYVKIGDYGLSKAMSASQHSGQTMTVGTVHYMAPEIGMGKYDRSIDIYAMGAVLYEMITGQVPYLGASPGEILMKHMSSEPNVQGIEEPFATVIRRAMAKDPAQRFQTVQEMVEAVFGAEHVRDSVSGFSPGDLSMVAGRVAQRIAVGVGGSSGPPMPPAPPVQPDSWQQAAFADRPNRMAGMVTPPPLPIPQLPPPVPPALFTAAAAASPRIQPDTIPSQQRYILAGVAILVIALAAGGFSSDFFPTMYFSLAAMAGALIGMLVGRQFILPKVPPHQGFLGRIAIGGPAALFGLVLAVPAFFMAGAPQSGQLGRTWWALFLPIAILNWIKWTGPHRVKRVSLAVAFTAAAFGLAMTWMTGGVGELAMAILGGIGLASGVMFPWEPRMFVPAAAAPTNNPSPLPAGLLAALREPRPTAFAAASPRPAVPAFASSVAIVREVPDWVRWMYRGLMALLIALGPVLIATAESNDPGFKGTAFVAQRAVGVGLIVLGIFCFLQSFRQRITSWWSYLIKPLVLYICLQTILLSAFELGKTGPNDDEVPVGIFFIIFPAIMFLTLLFVNPKPQRARAIRPYQPFPPNPPMPPASEIAPTAGPLPGFEPAAQQSPATFSSAPIAPPQHPRQRPQKLRILASLIGWALHTLTFFLAIAVLLDLPGFIAAGLLDQRLADDMKRSLGDNWARLAHLQGYILVYVGAFAATLFLMLARRSQGIAHMLRPIFAAACFLIATVMLDHGLNGRWKPLATPPAAQAPDPATANARQAQVTDAITQYLDAAQAKLAIISLFLALTGLTLLLWPAQPPRLESKIDREEGAA